MSNINKEPRCEIFFYSIARLISWFFLAGSILVLIYTYYRGEITYQGTMEEKYFKFYIISLMGILFWGVILRLNEKVRANTVLASISLVVGLYLCEGVLSFFDTRDGYPQRLRAGYAALQGINFDMRTRLQVIKDLRSEGVDAVPVVQGSAIPTEWQIKDGAELLFPFTGMSNKTTVYSNENGKYLIYLSDRYGFNNPDAEWDSMPTEWVLMGDSFTHGCSVQPGEDIAGQIRTNTNDSVINLGVGGNGPLLEFSILKEYAEPMRPEKVIWLYFEGNDLIDLKREREKPLFRKYLQDGFSQDLIHKQKEIDSKLEKYIFNKMKAEDEIEKKEAKMILYNYRWIRLASIRNKMSWNIGVVKPRPEVVIDPLFSEILTKAKLRTEA
jgi:hypothetical protein